MACNFLLVQFNGFMSLMSYFDVTYIVNITKTSYSRQFNMYLLINKCVMSVLTRATRRNIPEDAILHGHGRENLKSYKLSKFHISLSIISITVELWT
jgi:hypothetical protein